jgi:hypothetical protein
MKIKMIWIAGLALVALYATLDAPGPGPVTTEASAAQSKPSARLSMTAARNVTRAIAWEVARRNGSVNSVKVGACRRLTADRITCAAIDRGSTSVLETTCRLRVQVRFERGGPTGSLTGVNCENQRRALLRAEAAAAAIRQWAGQEIPDKEAEVGLQGRRSFVEFAGIAAWYLPSAANPTEVCFIELKAILKGSGEIEVTPGKSGCAS